ncbi:MAG TPA: hypothetical protein DCZ20_10060 [Lachnospiraceae bacterium]|nr:hypothetical protein [Lachnospiraceae bacterium]
MGKRISEYTFLFALGGCIYYSVEILFRGFSHWSMFILGGLALWFCTWQGLLVSWQDPLWRQMLRSILFVTALEFITGLIVNKYYHLAVWDYTDQPFQLFGQICLPFTILFSGLCAVGILLGAFLVHTLYREKTPHFHVL